jgi:hypothetical protein
VHSVVVATIVCGVYAAARYASLLSAQQNVAGSRRLWLGARRDPMHRRPAAVAFVIAIALDLVITFAVGRTGHPCDRRAPTRHSARRRLAGERMLT